MALKDKSMFKEERLKEAEKKKREWEEGTLKETLKRFGAKEKIAEFYSPADLKDYDFTEKVGFPGEYPFTAGIYASPVPGSTASMGSGFQDIAPGLTRAGLYSGYGAPENTRDFYQNMISMGQSSGPNLAFDLPTQCGLDSDNPQALGEVGRTGVAVDTLRDFEVIYEAFTGDMDLDKIASNWTINAPANILLAMYIALAEKRGIPQAKLRGTPQNDILKEYVGRGTYVFPPRPSMRMVRDTIVYCTKNMPHMNFISCSTGHVRQAGGTRAQTLAFLLSNATAYIEEGIKAGLDVDSFMPRFTFLGFTCGINFFPEIAAQRAARRMFAHIMKEKFGSKNQRNCILRSNLWAMASTEEYTLQRPLNNLTRGVVGGIMASLSGGTPSSGLSMPYDEPLSLGHSMEAWQLHRDAARIIQFEAGLCDVIDPLAGSYYVEALTDQIEEEAWEIYNKIEDMGGAVTAIEKGFIQQEVARSAYERQKEIESAKVLRVGMNCFTGEHELEVIPSRIVPHPYSPEERERAEEKQINKLKKIRQERDNQKVEATLRRLKEAARDEDVNLVPPILEAVKVYASVGEICGIFKEVFGEYVEGGGTR
ncbi:MAG: methylmalonyl-CoA mutase family protein [Syntrophales bacterium]|nr:methylmalonyl-CoA mutase family protein [Syntrophales bacterium]